MTEQGVSLAIVGVSSAAGEALLETLPEQSWSLATLHLLDERDVATGRIEIEGHYQAVATIEDFDFAGIDLVIFATKPGLARQYISRAREAGCLVLDLSGASSLDAAVPLVVAGVNDSQLQGLGRGGLLASPNPLTVQFCQLLQPLAEAGFPPQRIDAVACRAVNMHGKSGSEALAYETVQLLNMRQPERFGLGRQIAFNLLPAGAEEAGAVRAEIEKVLDKQDIEINLRVLDGPVFNANSLQCFIDFAQPCEPAQCKQIWANSAVLEIYDEGEAPSAVTEAAGNPGVIVGGLECRAGERPGISVWSVTDGLVTGVAGNAWDVVEILVKSVL
jgi:aspartate-semialdehyde dehydrogenase